MYLRERFEEARAECWPGLPLLDRRERELVDASASDGAASPGGQVLGPEFPLGRRLVWLTSGQVYVRRRQHSAVMSPPELVVAPAVIYEPRDTQPREVLATAAGPASFRVLDGEAIAEANERLRREGRSRDADPLEQSLRQFERMQEFREGFIAALRDTAAFGGVPVRALLPLLEGASFAYRQRGEIIVAANQDVEGLWYLCAGRADVLSPTDPLERALGGGGKDAVVEWIVASRVPGQLIGAAALGGFVHEPHTVRAADRCLLMRVDNRAFHRRAAESPSFARVVAPNVFPVTGGQPLRRVGDDPNVVLFHADTGDDVSAWVLATAAYHQSESEWNERVAVLRLRHRDGPEEVEDLGDTWQVRTYRLTVSHDDAAQAISNLLEAGLPAYDPAASGANTRQPRLVFLLPEEGSAAWLAPLARVVGRLVLVTADTTAARAPEGYPNSAVCWVCDLDRRAGHPGAHRPGSCRIRGREPLPPPGPGPFPARGAALAQSARLARAVSERRVGVAFGGGGAWGFAHVALIEALTNASQPIPIDAVSGTSFGAIVAAFYACYGPREYRQRLEAFGARLKRLVIPTMLGSDAFARQAALALEDGRLDEFVTPAHLVATNVVTVEAIDFESGPASTAVVASSAFPVVFPALALDKTHRMVDGGFVENVPVGPLVGDGVDFVIAANVVPVPGSKGVGGGLLFRVLSSLALPRFRDAYRASVLFMHTGGAASAFAADARWDSAPVHALPHEFDQGRKIADSAAGSAQAFVEEVRAAYARLVVAPGGP
ncbi:MAG: patatin-like phospholipase family protein [Deltaproteobacteria bacterium]|nr:patatin-like phospholipase family protein [Deltaproteobacteria bacterium]